MAASRAQVKVPRRCTWTTVSKSSSLMFHSTRSRSTPALVTMTSRRPKAWSAREHELLGGLRGADRHRLGDGPPARGGDRVDDGAGGVGVHVVDDDRGAGLGEGDGVGAAEALSGAGDDGDLAGDVHVSVLLAGGSVGWVGQPNVSTGLMVAPLFTSATACSMSAKS